MSFGDFLPTQKDEEPEKFGVAKKQTQGNPGTADLRVGIQRRIVGVMYGAKRYRIWWVSMIVPQFNVLQNKGFCEMANPQAGASSSRSPGEDTGPTKKSKFAVIPVGPVSSPGEMEIAVGRGF